MYNNQTTSYECDECLSNGICSISPALSAIHEIILLYLKELSFYILRLKKFGITNTGVKEAVIDTLLNIIANVEYSQEDFHELIVKLYDYILQSKNLYEQYCLENQLKIEIPKSYFKYSKNFDLIDAIRKGEKYFIKKINSFTSKQKNLYDILLFLAKSIAIKKFELKQLGKNHNEAYYKILSILDLVRRTDFSEKEVQNEIKKSIKVYYDIVKSVHYTQIELYGQIQLKEVSLSNQIGKAILVSGSDFKKLEEVLKAVENTAISVYTNGIEMFMAHAFPKLHNHPNLKGHFGAGINSQIIDFATFPGAILMTKCTLQKIEYLFRGRLFTKDSIPPKGVIRIKDNNYEPLIKSALEAEGFLKIQEKPSVKVGFDENKINQTIDYIIDKMLKNELRHLYIVGLINYFNIYKQYFDNFFNLLPDDCYAISLSYKKNGKNIFHQDSFCDYSLFYKILKRISEKISLNKANITIFLTLCDKFTLANLIYLKEIGIKNVYTCNCPSTLVNPTLIETLKEILNIKEFTDARKDISDTLKGNL